MILTIIIFLLMLLFDTHTNSDTFTNADFIFYYGEDNDAYYDKFDSWWVRFLFYIDVVVDADEDGN